MIAAAISAQTPPGGYGPAGGSGGAGGNGSAGVGLGSSTFVIQNAACNSAANCLQWVDDDATDNCGTATTNFMAAINAYAGPGFAQVTINGSGTGKAYLLQTCHLVFGPTAVARVVVNANATFDAGTNSNANLIQFGDGTHGGLYTWNGGTFVGGASLTVAGMESKNADGNTVINGVNWINFGAGNATLGSCTNYAIQFDNFVFEGTVSNNQWTMNDATTGRCFGNTAVATVGESTIFWTGNTIGGRGPSFCASQGIVDGGYYGTISNNNIGNIAVPIRIQGGGHRVEANQLDTEGCTANSVNAVINWGPSGTSLGIDGASIINNVAQFGAGHATHFFQKAGDTSAGSTISNINLIGNSQSVTSSTTAQVIGGTPPNCGSTNTGQYSFCTQFGNNGLVEIPSCGATTTGWQLNNKIGYCTTSTAAANIGSTALVTAPASGSLTPMMVTCQVMLTTAATTSSTLPQCVISYTDFFTNTTQTINVTPVWASGTVGCSGTTTNTVGNSCQATVGPLGVKSNTAVNYSTINYASTGATAMVAQAFVTAYVN